MFNAKNIQNFYRVTSFMLRSALLSSSRKLELLIDCYDRGRLEALYACDIHAVGLLTYSDILEIMDNTC